MIARAVPAAARPRLVNVMVGCSDCAWTPNRYNGDPAHDPRPQARRHTVATGHRTWADTSFNQSWWRSENARFSEQEKP